SGAGGAGRRADRGPGRARDVPRDASLRETAAHLVPARAGDALRGPTLHWGGGGGRAVRPGPRALALSEPVPLENPFQHRPVEGLRQELGGAGLERLAAEP